MLENWIASPKKSHFDYGKHTLGQKILLDSESHEQSKKDQIFLLCDKSDFASEVKNHLFNLYNHFDSISLVDLGTLKQSNPEFAISPFRELNNQGRIIFISEKDHYLNSIFQSIASKNESATLGYINKSIDLFRDETVQRALKSEKLFNMAILGYQRHFCSKSELTYLHNSFINHLSLGQLNKNIEQSEPVVRACHGVIINMTALTNTADKNGNYSPNGLSPTQVCQLAKYCSLNSSLQILNISKGDLNDKDKQICSLVSQMVWYFLEGANLTELSDLASKENLQQHLVQTTIDDLFLTFWKSKTSGQWWFEIPSQESDKSKIYPCSVEDYQAACRNEITEYILNQMNIDH